VNFAGYDSKPKSDFFFPGLLKKERLESLELWFLYCLEDDDVMRRIPASLFIEEQLQTNPHRQLVIIELASCQGRNLDIYLLIVSDRCFGR
jgi:hypothetical protein